VSSRASRPANTSYARITRQYVPAAALLVVVAVAISVARRELTPGLRGVTGDVAEAVVLAVIAIAGIGIAIVRPFERRMHERRRVSSQREHAYRAETERRDFERRIVSGLDLCEDMSDVLVTTRRAMVDSSGRAPAELLLANAHDLFERAVSTGETALGCLVDGPGGCPATRRGAAQCFDDSDSIDACPWLRNRPQGRVGAVCVPVSITGRALGVLHTTRDAGAPPSAGAVEQLTALADHVGARIGMLRLTAAAVPGADGSDLMVGAGVRRASTDGAAQELGAITGAESSRDPRDHEVAGVRATPAPEGPEGASHSPVEGGLLGSIE